MAILAYLKTTTLTQRRKPREHKENEPENSRQSLQNQTSKVENKKVADTVENDPNLLPNDHADTET